MNLYQTEADCVAALYGAKWPEGFRCPRCGHPSAYTLQTRRLPLYECTACHRQTSLTAGTVMQGSRTPLLKWFLAIHSICHSSASINAVKLAGLIKVTYKTAWLILHKLRHAITTAESQLRLSNIVRVDCSRFYSLYNAKHQNHRILLAAQISANHIVQFKSEPVPTATGIQQPYLQAAYVQPDIKKFVQRYIDPSATVINGGHQLVYRLRYWPLRQVLKQASFVINNTYHGLGPKYLHAYLNEYAFRLNTVERKEIPAPTLISYCSRISVITYSQLIGRQRLPVRRVYAGVQATA
ncbi:transposase [Paenibacillus tarimensis]|uniref:transposase n=1 Tax=Paenibacillus tarimensis TaxID=416012 RepID=UPI0039F070D3